METGKVPAVILAAGYSSRMEAFKPLLPLGEGLVLDQVAESLRRGGIEKIYLITGYERERLKAAAETHGLEEVYNPRFDRGMFSSIQAGINAMAPWAEGCFLVPVDCPLFGSATIEEMFRGLGDGDRFAVPTYRGKKGHPLYVPRKHFARILDHDDRGGLKAVTDAYFEDTLRIPVSGEGILLDMDTREDYQEVQDFLKRGQVSESLSAHAAGRRFILVRHGQIRQHREKIFLGQTDVLLSEAGEDQARAAAEEVKLLKAETDRIYASDLRRAWGTAEILAASAGGFAVLPVPGFREMSLGEWDGRYIADIRCEEPEAYRLRGEHIWIYKKGNRSENFFDLQYRVVKTLVVLLKEDSRRDVIIVAHQGVLRVIENNLRGEDVTSPWDPMDNGTVRAVEV